MPKNEEGEFELVLGNRELIGVFVVVVIFLGVFFSMGYILGRNSATPGAPATTARNEAPKPDTDATPAADADTNLTAAADKTSDQPAPADGGVTVPPVITKPAQESPKPETKKPEPPARKEEVKPKPSPASAPIAKPAPAAANHAQPSEPSSGQYWQVVATARPDAEIIAEALSKKGFHATLAPAPKDGVFRVLVGPLADASTQAQTRTGLESAGFKNPILRKY